MQAKTETILSNEQLDVERITYNGGNTRYSFQTELAEISVSEQTARQIMVALQEHFAPTSKPATENVLAQDFPSRETFMRRYNRIDGEEK